MIEIVKPEKPYTPEWGDVIWNGAGYLEPIPKTPPEGEVLMLSLMSGCHNTLKGLRMLDISDEPFEASKYTCWVTGDQAYGIVPIAVIHPQVADLFRPTLETTLKKGWYVEFVLDTQAHRRMTREDPLEPSEFVRLFLGSGFTDGTTSYDGSRGLKCTSMSLSNGAKVWVAFWEWYNK